MNLLLHKSMTYIKLSTIKFKNYQTKKFYLSCLSCGKLNHSRKVCK